MPPSTPPTAASLPAAALALGTAVFVLNDFALTSDFRLWLAVDYGGRLVVLAACAAAAGRPLRRLFGRMPLWPALAWAAAMVAVIAIDWALRPWADLGRLFHYPAIADPAWARFDTVAGLPLVALSEEVFGRGLFLVWAEARGWRPAAIVAVSALLFALIHWSLGLANLAVALVFGLLAMASLVTTRSLWPALAAHWLVDLALLG